MYILTQTPLPTGKAKSLITKLSKLNYKNPSKKQAKQAIMLMQKIACGKTSKKIIQNNGIALYRAHVKTYGLALAILNVNPRIVYSNRLCNVHGIVHYAYA